MRKAGQVNCTLDIKYVGLHDELFTSDLSGKQFAISVGDNEICSRLYNKLLDNAGIIPTLVPPSAIGIPAVPN